MVLNIKTFYTYTNVSKYLRPFILRILSGEVWSSPLRIHVSAYPLQYTLGLFLGEVWSSPLRVHVSAYPLQYTPELFLGEGWSSPLRMTRTRDVSENLLWLFSDVSTKGSINQGSDWPERFKYLVYRVKRFPHKADIFTVTKMFQLYLSLNKFKLRKPNSHLSYSWRNLYKQSSENFHSTKPSLSFVGNCDCNCITF